MRRFTSGWFLLSAIAVLGIAFAIAETPGRRATVSFAGVPPCTPMPSGLVSWWDANGDYDDIVSGFHGTPQGSVTTVPGYIDDAFSFERDNAGDFVKVGNPVELAVLPTGITVEAWINLESVPSMSDVDVQRSYAIVSKWNQVPIGGDSYYLAVGNDGSGAQLHSNIGNNLSHGGMFAGTLSTSTWHHVAMTYNTTTDLHKMYIDGVEVGSQTLASGILTTTVGLSIGRETGSTAPRFFDGLIDDARVYNRALSGAELDAIHDNGTNGMCPPPPPPPCTPAPTDLISWWPGNNSTTDIVSGFNGTATNGATYGTGKVGAAFDFERTASQYVQIGSPAALNSLPNGITLESWVKLESLPAVSVVPKPQLYSVVTKWNQVNSQSAYAIYVENFGGTVHFLGAIGNGAADPGLAGGVLSVDTWYHVVMTYDTATDQNRLYVNGTEVNNRVRANGITTSGVIVMIGRENSASPRYMDGRIDDARIYGRALSAGEVGALYAAGTGGVCSGPGTITIRKETEPDGAAQTFDFTGDVAGTLGDGGTLMSGPLAAGTYSVTETLPPAPWNLQSIVCDDADSTGSVPTRTATINVGAGEDVECVFTNGDLLFDLPDWFTTDNRWCKPAAPAQWRAVSTTPCGGFTQALPFGTQTIVDGASKLANGVARAFPYYWSRDGYFPASGDFVVTLRMKYDSLQPHGTGVRFHKWDDATPSGTNAPFPLFERKCPAWGVHAGSGGARYSFAGTSLVLSNPTAYHTFKMEYIDSANPLGGQYLLFVDGVLRIGPVRTTVRANRAWVGNYVFTNWASVNWTDFSVQALNVTQPALFDGDNDNIDDRVDVFSTTNMKANAQVDTDSDGLPDFCDPSTIPPPLGTIIIGKETLPDGSARPFTFSGAVAGTIVDGGTLTVDLAQGTYFVTEAVSTAWNVLNIDCDDDDSSVDNAARTATIELAPAEVVTCIFNNDCTGVGDTDCDGFLDPAVTAHIGPANLSLTLDNCPGVFNPLQTNTDGNFIDNLPPYGVDDKTWIDSDALGDACDPDDDNDGTSDADEATGATCAGKITNPLLQDTDGDRALDRAECVLGKDPADVSNTPTLAECGVAGDSDGDRLSDRVEFCYYDSNPLSADSDGDKALDGAIDGCEAMSFNPDRITNIADSGILGNGISGGLAWYQPNIDINKDGTLNIADSGLLALYKTPSGQCPG